MSTCPEKDIHSVYLDNELPLSYVKEYEAHIADCPKCAAELKKLKILKEAFSSESKEIEFSQEDLDKSFERLQAKMSYNKNIKKAKPVFDFDQFKASSKYILTGIAAAAVVAVILPVKNNRSNAAVASVQNNFEPIPRTSQTFSDFPSSSPALSASTVNYGYGNSDYRRDFNGEMPEYYYSENVHHRHHRRPVPPEMKFQGPSPYSQEFSHQVNGFNQIPDRASLSTYDLLGPLPDREGSFVTPVAEDKSKGFSIKLTSPFANISLEIGNGN